MQHQVLIWSRCQNATEEQEGPRTFRKPEEDAELQEASVKTTEDSVSHCLGVLFPPSHGEAKARGLQEVLAGCQAVQLLCKILAIDSR